MDVYFLNLGLIFRYEQWASVSFFLSLIKKIRRKIKGKEGSTIARGTHMVHKTACQENCSTKSEGKAGSGGGT